MSNHLFFDQTSKMISSVLLALVVTLVLGLSEAEVITCTSKHGCRRPQNEIVTCPGLALRSRPIVLLAKSSSDADVLPITSRAVLTRPEIYRWKRLPSKITCRVQKQTNEEEPPQYAQLGQGFGQCCTAYERCPKNKKCTTVRFGLVCKECSHTN